MPSVSFYATLLFLPCTLFPGLYCPGTHRASMESPLVFPVGQLCLDQIPFVPLSPSKNPFLESTSVVSPPMPEIVCAWQTCDGSSRVLFTLYHSQKLCAGRTRCTGRCTVQPTNLRYQEGCHFATLQNCGISMGVSFLFSLRSAIVEQV